jgi:hypothetical protein
MMHFNDPPNMPGTGEGPAERFASAGELAGTAAAGYLQKRHVPLQVAEAAEVRFDAQFAGRAAVVVALRDAGNRVTALHGRYLEVRRGQNKMLTFGSGGGVIAMPGGLQAEQPILVEGLFDALSLASCGWPCVATIGRWAPWLAEQWAEKTVWLGFDAGKPGEAEYARHGRLLCRSKVRRLLPPPRCQDWNTALVKRGPSVVAHWIREQLAWTGVYA